MTRSTRNPGVDLGTSGNAFHDMSAPQVREGRAWTFKHFHEACDTPGAPRVQAVLVASNTDGFALYARQNRSLHCVTRDGRPMVFRTIEHALSALADVPHLLPEIAIDITSW